MVKITGDKNMKIRLTALISILLISAAGVVYCQEGTQATVLEIIDAATLRVDVDGSEETLRLLGVKPPEAAPGGDDDGDAALTPDQRALRNELESLVFLGNRLSLEYDFEPRDRKNRLQAYAFLQDGSMLNYTIIYNGLADTKAEPPNVKYSGKFSMAADYAKSRRLGIWKTPPPPAQTCPAPENKDKK
jgi:micrococcal nuclease